MSSNKNLLESLLPTMRSQTRDITLSKKKRIKQNMEQILFEFESIFPKRIETGYKIREALIGTNERDIFIITDASILVKLSFVHNTKGTIECQTNSSSKGQNLELNSSTDQKKDKNKGNKEYTINDNHQTKLLGEQLNKIIQNEDLSLLYISSAKGLIYEVYSDTLEIKRIIKINNYTNIE